MKECAIPGENIRLLGRMDPANDPVALDWTGSGWEVYFQGSELWVELEAAVEEPDMWVACTVDGYPVTRFMVEKGRRWYPLVHGMSAELARSVSLMKETQPMPGREQATVYVYGLRYEGELLPLPEPALRIEFIGDSLTSAEGTLAPRGNTEWLPMWFSACANYSHYACRELRAERRVLSQSGWGVLWDWQRNEANNMSEGYERVVGVLQGEAARQRGCDKPYDFSSWKADVVCIRLLSNDIGGMRRVERVEELTPILTEGCVRLIHKVRACNPQAHILWILPGSQSIPQIGIDAVQRCLAEGMTDVSYLKFPDYVAEDMGARSHPNAAYNERVGRLLAQAIAELRPSAPKE